MPSFDIVSQVDLQEVDNAVNQTLKEVGTRYDFKGSRVEIVFDKENLNLVAGDDYKMKALIDMLQGKMAKRGVSLKAFPFGPVEPSVGTTVKCAAKMVQGVSQEVAREMVKWIKGTALKVQAQIQGEVVRVTGKKLDDLQQVIAGLRAKDWPISLQFINFRD